MLGFDKLGFDKLSRRVGLYLICPDLIHISVRRIGIRGAGHLIKDTAGQLVTVQFFNKTVEFNSHNQRHIAG